MGDRRTSLQLAGSASASRSDGPALRAAGRCTAMLPRPADVGCCDRVLGGQPPWLHGAGKSIDGGASLVERGRRLHTLAGGEHRSAWRCPRDGSRSRRARGIGRDLLAGPLGPGRWASRDHREPGSRAPVPPSTSISSSLRTNGASRLRSRRAEVEPRRGARSTACSSRHSWTRYGRNISSRGRARHNRRAGTRSRPVPGGSPTVPASPRTGGLASSSTSTPPTVNGTSGHSTGWNSRRTCSNQSLP